MIHATHTVLIVAVLVFFLFWDFVLLEIGRS